MSKQLPDDQREAMAAHFLSELEAQQEQTAKPAGDDRSHPLPGASGRVPFERIKHLAGIAKEGPSDLATNKRYLDDLAPKLDAMSAPVLLDTGPLVSFLTYRTENGKAISAIMP